MWQRLDGLRHYSNFLASMTLSPNVGTSLFVSNSADRHSNSRISFTLTDFRNNPFLPRVRAFKSLHRS